jgi:hypothetical protein
MLEGILVASGCTRAAGLFVALRHAGSCQAAHIRCKRLGKIKTNVDMISPPPLPFFFMDTYFSKLYRYVAQMSLECLGWTMTGMAL